MARMIPAQIYSGNPSPGEKEIFRRLADDPDTANWIVLHSLDIANHIKNVAGEADFVVIVPHMGVLCLEVKATSRVRRENGLWYFGSDSKPDRRGPFKQASEAMHSIRKRIAAKNRDLKNVLFWSAVIFPYIHFKIESGEWHDWQVIDNNAFRQKPISSLIVNVLTESRNHLISSGATWFAAKQNEPTRSQCEQIANALRPDFEVFEAPRNRVERLTQDVKKYTEEQFIALDAMAANPRVIFSGPAGTGKTILAIEAANRSVSNGNRVLLICFNRLLGRHLEKEMGPLVPRVTVSTLHKHMLSIAGIQLGGQSRSSEFWNIDLPQIAIDKLLQDSREDNTYDEIIVDEAQDLLQTMYLDFIDLSVKGGLSAGKWKIFGDFEKQAIYGMNSDLTIEEAFTTRLNNAPRYSLRVNCRNTPRIASLVSLLGDLTPEYSRILRPDDGIEPKIMYYSDQPDQQRKLLEIIAMLKDDGFSNNDIVILSTKSAENSSVYGISDNSVRFTSFESASRKRIGSGSIHAFKGIESPAVIVTDVEIIGGEQARSLFYIAITRALHRLYILANETVRQEVLKITLNI